MKKVKESNFILNSRTRGEKVLYAIIAVVFAIYSLALLFPFLWTLIQSLQDANLYDFNNMLYGPFALPKSWHFENYVSAFSKMKHNNVNFLTMIFNSLWYVGLGCTWCMIWPVVTGYVISKYKFKGKELIYGVAVFCMTVPIVGTSGALYKLISLLGIYDKGPLYVILTGVNGFSGNFLVLYGIFKGISWTYAEAVFIDGGGDFTAFVRIMLPQAMPAICALMISGAIGLWNESYNVMMYMPSTPTVASGLYYISLNIDRFGRPLYYAGLIFSIVPVVIIYSFTAGSMMKNLSIGGIKG